MKKAVLFEPKLLAKVERNSPDLYEYYSKSPLSQIEFVDYGLCGNKMYGQKKVFETIETFLKNENFDTPKIMMCLQAGYYYGLDDIRAKYGGYHTDSLKCGIIIGVLLNLGLNYPYYDEYTLLNADNFFLHDKFFCSTYTYKEAQYFEAWREIFRRHDGFNDIFIDINKKRKAENLDNMGIIDFSGAFN